MTNNKTVQIKRKIVQILLYLILIVILLWTLVPIVLMVSSSLKVEAEMFTMPPKLFFKPNIETYVYMFKEAGFFSFFLNSIIAAGVATAFSLFIGTMGGFALARGKFPNEKGISFWIISTRMAPLVAFIIPIYLLLAKARLVGTMVGLIYAYTTFCLPFVLWMSRNFFKDVPYAIEEAALVDGCTKFQTFHLISLPSASGGIAATAILCFMFTWNDYLYASILTGKETQTITVATSLLITQHGIAWGQAMAIGTIITLPMIFLGLAVRKYLVQGLSMGAVK